MQTGERACVSTVLVGFGGAAPAQQATDQPKLPAGASGNAAETAQEAAAADAGTPSVGTVEPPDEGTVFGNRTAEALETMPASERGDSGWFTG